MRTARASARIKRDVARLIILETQQQCPAWWWAACWNFRHGLRTSLVAYLLNWIRNGFFIPLRWMVVDLFSGWTRLLWLYHVVYVKQAYDEFWLPCLPRLFLFPMTNNCLFLSFSCVSKTINPPHKTVGFFFLFWLWFLYNQRHFRMCVWEEERKFSHIFCDVSIHRQERENGWDKKTKKSFPLFRVGTHVCRHLRPIFETFLPRPKCLFKNTT